MMDRDYSDGVRSFFLNFNEHTFFIDDFLAFGNTGVGVIKFP
jgi:hypothetical protein